MTRIVIAIVIYFFEITSILAQVTTEEILIKNDSIQLLGTLTYTTQKSPLIIWIHGSGNIDRNGNQAGVNIKANYIQQFREQINAYQIAFFSYDKRTANSKNKAFLKKTLYTDLVNDAKKIIAYFKDDKRFSEIVLIGHSQGSLTAMLASENATKYISIAGTSTSVDKIIVQQITKQNAVLGKVAKSHFKELSETGGIKEVNPFLISIFAKQNLAFIQNWATYNPSEEIKKLEIPILIINGNKDLQVPVEEAENLKKAKPTARLVIIENMNHVVKDIQKDEDNLKSYYSPDYMVSKKLIVAVLDFTNKPYSLLGK